MKRICVLGLGYIGLPTACLLATHGYQVTGVDVKREVVDRISRGEAPFEEPGLKEILQKATATNTLTASTKVGAADVFLIAVPTPLVKETRLADLSYVSEAAGEITRYIKRGNLVILESTVPPGTCERLLIPILEKSGLKGGSDFHFVHCPERAIPGNTIYEMIHDDRVIGGINRESAELAKEVYSSFVKGRLYLTDLRSAEIIKLMENTYRDINIALANEFAQIAEEDGINIWEAIELANKHPRVNILKPGPGVGGHCLAKDPWFLAGELNRSRIISLAREINDSMPNYVLRLVKELLVGIDKPVITVLGVAYKGNVDDTRETPALKFIKSAISEGHKVKVHDPWVKSFDYKLLSLESAAKDSDCLVLITDHSSFKQIDPVKLGSLMRHRNLVDTRNILAHKKWQEAGFKVRILGVGTHHG